MAMKSGPMTCFGELNGNLDKTLRIWTKSKFLEQELDGLIDFLPKLQAMIWTWILQDKSFIVVEELTELKWLID